jgi:hypothetical protein
VEVCARTIGLGLVRLPVAAVFITYDAKNLLEAFGTAALIGLFKIGYKEFN